MEASMIKSNDYLIFIKNNSIVKKSLRNWIKIGLFIVLTGLNNKKR